MVMFSVKSFLIGYYRQEGGGYLVFGSNWYKITAKNLQVLPKTEFDVRLWAS